MKAPWNQSGWLVETLTSDGLRLNGFLQTARPKLAPALWIVTHGVAGNFYNSSLLASVSDCLLGQGDDVLRINTRGRDAVCYLATRGGMTRGGAAYEQIDDARLDLAAWSQFAYSQGYQHVHYLGHSLGAVKSILHVVATASDQQTRLICLSPPRLCPSVLSADRKYAQQYQNDVREALEAMARGEPEHLMTIRFPQPMLITAATYLDKYANHQRTGNHTDEEVDRYDYMRHVLQLKCRSLWCFGEHEVRGPRSSFADCDRLLMDAFGHGSTHSIAVVPGGDHAYTGVRDDLTRILSAWLTGA